MKSVDAIHANEPSISSKSINSLNCIPIIGKINEPRPNIAKNIPYIIDFILSPHLTFSSVLIKSSYASLGLSKLPVDISIDSPY